VRTNNDRTAANAAAEIFATAVAWRLLRGSDFDATTSRLTPKLSMNRGNLRKTHREPRTHLRFEINAYDSCSHPLQQRKFISSTSARSET
jgi:hypothetical protein